MWPSLSLVGLWIFALLWFFNRLWPNPLLSGLMEVIFVLNVIACLLYFVWRFVSTAREVRRDELKASRIANGLCAECGYNLQATRDRCPECGSIPAQ